MIVSNQTLKANYPFVSWDWVHKWVHMPMVRHSGHKNQLNLSSQRRPFSSWALSIWNGKLLKQVENRAGKALMYALRNQKVIRRTAEKFFFAESDKEAREVGGRTQEEASMFCGSGSLQHSDSENSAVLWILLPLRLKYLTHWHLNQKNLHR